MARTSQTTRTRGRYNRIAPIYDFIEAFVERAAIGAWRQLWEQVPRARILEVGVGTGKNMPYYPPEASVTAVDLSERMLDRARRRAAELRLDVDWCQMDIDFNRNQIVVRRGKRQKDRVTMLPAAMKEQLATHFLTVKRQHERDLTRGGGRVVFPFALDGVRSPFDRLCQPECVESVEHSGKLFVGRPGLGRFDQPKACEAG